MQPSSSNKTGPAPERQIHKVTAPERQIHKVTAPEREIHKATAPEGKIHKVTAPERHQYEVTVGNFTLSGSHYNSSPFDPNFGPGGKIKFYGDIDRLRRKVEDLEPKSPVISYSAQPVRLENGNCYGYVKLDVEPKGVLRKLFRIGHKKTRFISVGNKQITVYKTGLNATVFDPELHSYWQNNSTPLQRNHIVSQDNACVLWSKSLEGAKYIIVKCQEHEKRWKATMKLQDGQKLKFASMSRANTYHGWKWAFENALADSPNRTFFDPNMPTGEDLEFYEDCKRQIASHDSKRR